MMNMNISLWQTLEAIPGLVATGALWRRRLGDDFGPFQRYVRRVPDALLSKKAQGNPEVGCASARERLSRPAGCSPDALLGACARHRPSCFELPLSRDELALWRLDWREFTGSLSHALGLHPRTSEFPLPHTTQIGGWSTDSVPAILTIQNEADEFRSVLAELVARLRRPFILLSPTTAHLTATCQELLANAGAAFFPLHTHVILTERGSFQSSIAPGELFARFTPEPKEPSSEDLARQVFALIEQLDAESRRKPPSVLTVYRLYGREELSVREVAKKCQCSVATVMERLNVIRAKTGLSPQNLRRLSPHLEKVADDITDWRAERIHPQSAIYGDED